MQASPRPTSGDRLVASEVEDLPCASARASEPASSAPQPSAIRDTSLSPGARRRRGAGGSSGGAGRRVLVPAAAALAAEPARGHHPRLSGVGLQRGSPKLQLGERLRDLEADVDARRGPSARTGPCGSRRRGGRCGRSARGVAMPLLQQPQRLRAERPAAAVDEEARPVGRVDHVACPSPRRARARAPAPRSPDSLAGDHLEQPHQRRRVEEVHARRRAPARRGAAPAIAVTGIEDVLVASTQSRAARSPTSAREQLALELEPLGRGLDHQLAVGAAPRASRAGCSRAAAASASSALQRPRSAPFARFARSSSTPRSQRLGDGVVQQRARAGEHAPAARSRRPSCRRRRRRRRSRDGSAHGRAR